jgi:hypothetical protein
MSEARGSSTRRSRVLGAAVLLAIGAYALAMRDPLVIAMVLAEIARAVLAPCLAARSRSEHGPDPLDVSPGPPYPTASPDAAIQINLSITIELTRPRR